MSIFISEEALEKRKDNMFIQAINEAYFGRTPGITRCFNAFCDFRDKYVSKDLNLLRGIKHIDADHDKDLHIFCREMERQFGFASLSFIIKNDIMENMYTYPIVFGKNRFKGKPSDFIYVDKEGYHYKKESETHVIIAAYSAMLFDAKYSNEESFSIVLHEVGHNFQQFLDGNMYNLYHYNQVFFAIGIIEEICYILLNIENVSLDDIFKVASNVLISNDIHKKFNALYNKLTADELTNNVYSYFNFIKGLLSLKNIPSFALEIPYAPAKNIIIGLAKIVQMINPIAIPIKAYNYYGEQIADNFPTYYGFGLSATTHHLHPRVVGGPAVNMISKIPVVGHLYNLLLIPGELLIYLGDEHPMNITRAKGVINSMKEDVKDPSLSPKLRKELEQTIKESEDFIDDYYKKAINIKNPRITMDLVYRYIYYVGEGGNKYKTMKAVNNVEKNVTAMTNKLRTNTSISDTKII